MYVVRMHHYPSWLIHHHKILIFRDYFHSQSFAFFLLHFLLCLLPFALCLLHFLLCLLPFAFCLLSVLRPLKNNAAPPSCRRLESPRLLSFFVSALATNYPVFL